MSRVYLPVKLTSTGSGPLDMEMRAAQFPIVTAGFIHFSTDVFIGGDEVPAYYIEAPLSGVAQNVWRDGRMERTTLGSAAAFSPGMPVDLNWSSDCREICLKVSEAQMHTQLEAMLNRPVRKRITLARNMNLNTQASHDWSGWCESWLPRQAGPTAYSLTGLPSTT